jgi:hypothetical protein
VPQNTLLGTLIQVHVIRRAFEHKFINIQSMKFEENETQQSTDQLCTQPVNPAQRSTRTTLANQARCALRIAQPLKIDWLITEWWLVHWLKCKAPLPYGPVATNGHS